MMSLDTVHSWLAEATSFQSGYIIRENELGPMPAGNFISFGLLDVTLHDYDYLEKVILSSTTLTVNVHNNALVKISVSVFSKDGYAILSALKQSKHKSTVSKIFNDANIALVKMNGIRDLTKDGDTVHQYRYQADFVFSCAIKSEFTEQRITQYLLSGNWGPDEILIDVPKQIEE